MGRGVRGIVAGDYLPHFKTIRNNGDKRKTVDHRPNILIIKFKKDKI